MFKKDIVVRCESGLHNQQATYFVQKANEFECSIYLESENRKMHWNGRNEIRYEMYLKK